MSARLVEALLVNCYYRATRLDEAIYLLERLYLDAGEYSPAILAMASILTGFDQFEDALDFAREAFSLQEINLQAQSFIVRLKEIDE